MKFVTSFSRIVKCRSYSTRNDNKINILNIIKNMYRVLCTFPSKEREQWTSLFYTTWPMPSLSAMCFLYLPRLCHDTEFGQLYTRIGWKVHGMKNSLTEKFMGWNVYRMKSAQKKSISWKFIGWKVRGWKVHWIESA